MAVKLSLLSIEFDFAYYVVSGDDLIAGPVKFVFTRLAIISMLLFQISGQGYNQGPSHFFAPPYIPFIPSECAEEL